MINEFLNIIFSSKFVYQCRMTITTIYIIDLFFNITGHYRLFSLLTLFGILVPDFIERNFPNEFRAFIINVSYNSIYLYSKLQALLFKYNRILHVFIDSNPLLLRLKNKIAKMVDYFYNKDLNNTIDDDYSENMIDNCDGYDFYIQNFTCNNKYVNKQIYFSDSGNPINEPCEIKFILIEFKYGDKLFKINLKTDMFNYYLVGNKFTKDFFMYYVKKHINSDESFDTDEKYAVEIIDHNINKVEIEFNSNGDGFVLEKNDYKIIKN